MVDIFNYCNYNVSFTDILIFLPHLLMFTTTFANLLQQSYFYNDDTFNFNYAQAKAAVGNYKEAEEVGAFLAFSKDIRVPTPRGNGEK